MPIKLHNLKSNSSSTKKRIGRGGKRGTYSGRGLKGQRSRSGGKRGLKRLGLKPLMTQTHKLRGFKSPHAKPETVNLKDLQKFFKDGEIVSPGTLLKRGLIKTRRNGVKILGMGKLTHKLTVVGCSVSESVASKVTVKDVESKSKATNKKKPARNKQ